MLDCMEQESYGPAIHSIMHGCDVLVEADCIRNAVHKTVQSFRTCTFEYRQGSY
jgi:hypothetical protein